MGKKKKIGLLTSGGDCQGLNAALRGVAKGLDNTFDEVEFYGFTDGYRGLIECEYKTYEANDFSGILTMGGTILGTSRQPYKQMRVIDENSVDKVAAMKRTYQKLGLDCLVILGGNGTHKTANLLSGEGLHIVTLPKTIDNDIYGTDRTFGFYSAVDIATHVIECIHTTAFSHSRVFIVELMGHKAGWLTLYAGIGGGADVILLPEIPYDIDKVAEAITRRNNNRGKFAILAVAEGAMSVEESKMRKKEFKAARAAMAYPSVSYRLAAELEEKTGKEIRVTVPGHFQRGGSPNASDRIFCSLLGAAAAELIAKEQYGYMVGYVDNKFVPVSLSEVAGKLKLVPPDCQYVTEARRLGISFGD